MGRLEGARCVVTESCARLIAIHPANSKASAGVRDILTWPEVWSGRRIEVGPAENLDFWLGGKERTEPHMVPSEATDPLRLDPEHAKSLTGATNLAHFCGMPCMDVQSRAFGPAGHA
jgi:hypothetical protein